MLKRSSLDIDLNLSDRDLEQVFEAYDPLAETGLELPELPGTEPFDPIDWDYLNAAEDGFLRDIIDHYFRGRLLGAEKLPKEGPLIVAPNHSGNAFPHDAVVLDGLLWRHDGFDRSAKFRTVFSPKLAATWWMRPYGIDNWWRRCGGVDMTFANFDRLLARGDRVIYYPEGVPGIGKGFLNRYRLQHYYSSFVVLAARHDAPVYPVSVVNAEWVNPTSMTFEPLNRLFDRLLGLPFFPVPIVFLAFLFPFLFYLAFPSRMVFVVGDAIDVRRMLAEEGAGGGKPDRTVVKKVAERIRREAQRRLDAAVARHGQRPYGMHSLMRHLRALGRRAWRTTPLGWPYAYVRDERDRHRPPARNRLHAALRDVDLLAFYLPLGWFASALMRRLRRPPYGYRGLGRSERLRREGAYRWSLEHHPLPPRAPAPGGTGTPEITRPSA